jgi:hypothetical protein
MDKCRGGRVRSQNVVDCPSRCLIADLDVSPADQVGPVDRIEDDGVGLPR